MSLKNNAPAPIRGLVTAEIGGQVRTFKFGMNTLSAYSRMHTGVPGDFMQRMSDDLFGATRDMLYCALQQRAADNNLPADFTPETVGDWVDEMEQAELNRVVEVMNACMSVGKPAPVTQEATTPAVQPTA